MTHTLTSAVDQARQTLADLNTQGINLQEIEQQLQTKAVADLRQAYQHLTSTVMQRRDELAKTF